MMSIMLNSGKILTWHVGEPVPVIKQPSHSDEDEIETLYVVEIYADFHELEYVKDKFKNIPMCDGRRIIWTGDFARFIFKNLS